MLLYHFKKNQDTLAKTTEIVRMMAFITFLFLNLVTGNIIRYLTIEKPE